MLPGQAFAVSSSVTHGLGVLLSLSSTDLHFVADDWSGSGTWTSRDSNHWAATAVGSSLVKQASSQFAKRSEVAGFATNGNYFSLGSNSAHGLTAGAGVTFEFIIKMIAN